MILHTQHLRPIHLSKVSETRIDTDDFLGEIKMVLHTQHLRPIHLSKASETRIDTDDFWVR